MYQNYQRSQIFDFKLLDHINISSFISVFDFHDETINDVNLKLTKIIENNEHEALINKLSGLLFYQILSNIKIDENITKSKSENQIKVYDSFKSEEKRELLQQKIFDVKKLEQLFSLKLNIIELEKQLIIVENSYLIKHFNKVHFVSNIIKLIYKYLIIQISNIVYWNHDDNTKSKYTYRGVIDEFKKLSKIADGGKMPPINRLGANTFIINFYMSLNEVNVEKGEELINFMDKISTQNNYFDLIWKTVVESIEFNKEAKEIEINNLLRPFYHYLIKNIKDFTSDFYDMDDSNEKKLFRDFKYQFKKRLKP